MCKNVDWWYKCQATRAQMTHVTFLPTSGLCGVLFMPHWAERYLSFLEKFHSGALMVFVNQ